MHSQVEILKKASILIDTKNYYEAKSILLEFIKNSKNVKIDERVYYLLYLSHENLKEVKSAKKYLEKCLKINKNNHIALNNLANIYFREKVFVKAEKLYLKSIESKKDYLIAIVNIAIFYENMGKLEEAKNFYLKAINLSPKQISIYYNLSRIDQNFFNEARKKYLIELMSNEKIELSNMAHGFFLLAEYERKDNSYIKEIEYLEKAHEYMFKEKLKKNERTLNYWQNVIPNQYNKFSFINENKQNELLNLEPIFIVGLPRSG